MRVLILIACLLHVAYAAPQFFTLSDGKIGVNIGGYHASAKLDASLLGHALNGGLSADVGTPWGPKAAVGIGGGIDGKTNRIGGVATAGAEVSQAVGTSAVIGGAVNEGGIMGSETHVYDKVSSNSLSSVPDRMYGDAPAPTVVGLPDNTNAIQKVKPPKKYSLIKTEQPHVAHSKQLVKTVQRSVAPPQYPMQAITSSETSLHVNSGLVGNVLNIPIGILRSLQESLSGIQVDKTVNFAHAG